jgi:hypothetical protein
VWAHIQWYKSIGVEGWINQQRKGPRYPQLSVRGFPWNFGMTERHSLEPNDLTRFDGYLASQCGHGDDQNNLAFDPGASDH